VIRKRFGEKKTIVTIMPCPDKKLESIRFDMGKDGREIELTLTTEEIVSLVKLVDAEDKFNVNHFNC
jgi:iron only hydrogenase large subunit-like protein